jgi:predicted permease
MTPLHNWLFRAALRIVPGAWRGSVERDLRDDAARFAALEAAAIGVRLRGARLRDALNNARSGRSSLLRDVGRDVRLAARAAVRRPAHAIAVVATLAVGIGANTAIFSVFNWILFRPVPGVAAPDELITVRFKRPSSDGRFFVSYRDYADVRDGVQALSGLAASASMPLNVAVGPATDAERVDSEMATSNYFDVLGVRFTRGRGFRPADETAAVNTPPAVISDALWRRTFSADPAILGRDLVVNGHTFTIVGVTPDGFQGRSLLTATDLWVPIGAHMAVSPGDGADVLTNRRRTLFIDAIGRLRPGATLEQAQQQAVAVASAIADFGGRRPTAGRGGPLPAMFPGLSTDAYTVMRLTTIWRLLMGAVGLLLLLACANAANLLLARALGRRREIAVCQAIGASRLRIVRQQLTEGMLLSLVAGAGGLALARVMTSLFEGMSIVSYLPALRGVAVDWRVGGFTLLVAATTGLVFSLAPAVASSRADLQRSLKDGVTASPRGGGRLRAALVIVQVAVSVLLLVNAGLFVRTLRSLRAVDLGLRLDGLVTFSADPTRVGYTTEQSHQYFQTLLERLRAAPGIDAAAFSWRTPYSNIGSGTGVRRDGEAETASHDAETNTISPDYFRAVGTPVVAGRDFTEDEFRRALEGEDFSGVDAVIINRRLAREVFPGGDAVGSSLVLDYPKGKRVQVVGIVGDIRGRPVTNDPAPCLYWPGTVNWGSVNVRSSMPLAQTAAAIRDVARVVEPALPPYDLEPMAAGVDRVISEQRLFARLSAIFAALASLLAAIGIYGMMAGAVAERRRELGIRVALGADARTVRALVLTGALPVALAGALIGLGASTAMRKAIEARLFGVRASDPATLAGVVAVLLIITLAASLIPALRAARTDPVQSLRAE